MSPIRINLGILAVMTVATWSSAADWPSWRGLSRDGHTTEPSGWDGRRWFSDQPRWQAKVGEGSSSPIVINEQLYVYGHEAGKDILRCLQASTGKEVWAARFSAPRYGRFHEGDEGLYSGPSSTPEYDPSTGYLYLLGVDGDLRCLDTGAAGKQLWHHNLYAMYKIGKRPKLTRAPQRDYGYTSSPLIYREWLIVEAGTTTNGTLIAFDKRTGKEVWTSDLKDEAGHTGGMARIDVEGVPCVCVITQRNVAVIRLDSGKEGKTVATFPWVTDFANTIASPAVFRDSVLVTAAYNWNAMCRIQFTLHGAKEIWRVSHPSKVCTPIVHDGKVYVAWRRVRALDWDTGKLLWEGGNFGDPGSCIVTSDQRLIVYGGNGKVALVETAQRSAKEYTERAAIGPLFKTHAWPHVVLANGRLYCRDREGNLVCLERGK